MSTARERAHHIVTIHRVPLPNSLDHATRAKVVGAGKDVRGVYWYEFKPGQAPAATCTLCHASLGGRRRAWVSALGEVLCTEGVHIE